MKQAIFHQKIGWAWLFFIFVFGVVVPTFSIAGKTYDVYVDDSYSGDEEGTKEKPYRKISEAIEAVMENSPGDRSIYLSSGSYSESIVLGKRVRLVGESQKKVSIMGKVTLGDDSSIANLTVSGKGSGVVVSADASVTIENCRIRDFGKIGIFAMGGNGKVTVRDNEIKGGAGKGLYIEPGREIIIIGNSIVDNAQEGLDIRYGVKGIVEDNVIDDNGESGIELIIGESTLEIAENQITGNGSSGIANQIYPDTKKNGKVTITANTLSANKKFGLDCNTPQKDTGALHWAQSISLKENVFENNTLGSISDTCGRLRVIERNAEAKDNVLQEETPVPETTETVVIEPEENIFDETEMIVAEHEVMALKLEKEISFQEARRGFAWWFVGLRPAEREVLLREQQMMHTIFLQLEELEKSVQREENRVFLSETKSHLGDRERGLNGRIERLEKRFSLGGFVRNLLKR